MSDKLSQIIPFMPPYKVGYYPGMIYDVPRNQFYYNLLKQCQEKVCADVGFGTGLLTVIALHHGAKHVYAYEKDPTSFQFGKQVIENMGLSDRVTFINGEYFSTLDEEIVFSEIVDRSIWGEGLRKVQKVSFGKMIPETVSCNIRYMKITDEIKKEKDDFCNTGLPFGTEYNLAIEQCLLSNEYTSYDNVNKKVLSGDILNSYTINLNDSHIPNKIELELNIPENDIIIWCENFINDFRLMDGHWRSDKVVHKFKKGAVKFTQSTDNGNWWLE